jgi:pyridinium-3,5-bisthiocarboxylic acid mononucleotide nickel chelatase
MECSTGASGDMIMASLAGLLSDPSEIVRELNLLNIPGVEVCLERSEKAGIVGNHMKVSIHGEEEDCEKYHHHHATPENIGHLIDSLKVSEKVKKDAKEIYDLIAEAESNAHGVPVENVHFHEVGMLDAITDVIGACLLIEILAPEQIISSPIHTGKGHVKCMHGILPIPAPATEFLLRGIPSFAGDVEGEFCTPTGAAIIRHFADRFADMPLMIFDSVGYGMGKNNFPMANFMRAFLGEAKEDLPQICEISCNIDDMYPEDLSITVDVIFQNGALDAFITPIIMKKGRPGSMLTCICRPNDVDNLSKIILKNTSTIGVRIDKKNRYEMISEIEQIDTEFGKIRIKRSRGFGIEKEKPEFEDLERISKERGIPVIELRNAIYRR